MSSVGVALSISMSSELSTMPCTEQAQDLGFHSTPRCSQQEPGLYTQRAKDSRINEVIRAA